MPDVPAGKTVVAESGYERREQIEELERIGVDAVLVGEALMRAGDPEARVRELTPRRGSDPRALPLAVAAPGREVLASLWRAFCSPFSGRPPNSRAMQRVKRIASLSARLAVPSAA